MSKTIEGIIAALERHAEEAERQAAYQIRECTRELLKNIARDHHVCADVLSECLKKKTGQGNKTVDKMISIS